MPSMPAEPPAPRPAGNLTRRHRRAVTLAALAGVASLMVACGNDDGAGVRDITPADAGTGSGTGSGSATAPGTGSGSATATGSGTSATTGGTTTTTAP